MNFRVYIARLLWTGAGLLIVICVAALCALWLRGLGDRAGAGGACGVAVVAGACWVLDFIALVLLLAVQQLRCGDSAGNPDEPC